MGYDGPPSIVHSPGLVPLSQEERSRQGIAMLSPLFSFAEV